MRLHPAHASTEFALRAVTVAFSGTTLPTAQAAL
jgi:hypothetical protein